MPPPTHRSEGTEWLDHSSRVASGPHRGRIPSRGILQPANPSPSRATLSDTFPCKNIEEIYIFFKVYILNTLGPRKRTHEEYEKQFSPRVVGKFFILLLHSDDELAQHPLVEVKRKWSLLFPYFDRQLVL
jgi:hypothetical protein